MSGVMRAVTAVGAAVVLGAGVIATAPAASAQDPDAVTLSMVSISRVNAFIPDQVQFGDGTIWCDDGGKRSSKTPPPKGDCNYPTNDGPLQLLAQYYLRATASTTSTGPVSFSVTGNCSVGTSAYAPSVGPSATAQVASGSDIYVASLQQGQQCVVTASTPGNAALAPATYTYTITTPVNVDGITLNVAALGDEQYKTGTTYWCSDGADASCGFTNPKSPVNLAYQQTISAAVFTAANTAETVSFSVSGDCAVGTSAFDPNSTPTTTAQVTAGNNVYLTALSGTGECVMTGSTPGTASLSPGTYTYTVNLTDADQQVVSPVQTLQMPKRMKVGQRFRVKGVDPQVTNAGQQISWRVLPRSRDNCRLTELTSGAVVLRARSRGTCRIQATAPAVPGQWNRFVQRFSVAIR